MKIRLLSTSAQKAVYLIEGSNPYFVNAVRRKIISGLPCFAINEVTMFENNSSMFNDYLANRIGLIPLTFDESVDAQSPILLSLDATGPGIVTSESLKSSEERIKPVNDDFPIIELTTGKLRFEATAVLGTGRAHARHQCAIASFSYYPHVEFKKMTPEARKRILEVCPQVSEKGGKLELDSDAYVQANPVLEAFSDEVGIAYDETSFVFFVESYNNVDAQTHFRKALELLEKDCEECAKEL
ncbi:DNA-directed RNA polymerase subunit D [Candidatus Micrarchaeota archaeon]|nr:DNA-directed RNA polymerase subunit D [Candidatus Micrarchaeota archaeon]